MKLAPQVRIAGLDWSTSPDNRALVTLNRSIEGEISLERLWHSVPNEVVVDLCRDMTMASIGVDTPFGWPLDFSAFVANWRPGRPAGNNTAVPPTLEFCLRRTDRVIHDELGKPPLSVSTNLIGVSARAWAELVHGHALNGQCVVAEPKQSPLASIIEVYPAATLIALLGTSDVAMREIQRYKQKRDKHAAASARRSLLHRLCDCLPLQVPEGQRDSLIAQRSDELDALAAALTVAAFLGWLPGWSVRVPIGDEISYAGQEGWIYFPIRQV